MYAVLKESEKTVEKEKITISTRRRSISPAWFLYGCSGESHKKIENVKFEKGRKLHDYRGKRTKARVRNLCFQ